MALRNHAYSAARREKRQRTQTRDTEFFTIRRSSNAQFRKWEVGDSYPTLLLMNMKVFMVIVFFCYMLKKI